MGSFSWLKADNLTNVKNIVSDKPFKFLIPKEFGGGFIKDNYQDYGHLGYKKDGRHKYDMYELLAFWNHEQIIPASTDSTVIYKKFDIGETVTLKLNSNDDWLDEVMKYNGKQFKITKTGIFNSYKKHPYKIFYLEKPLNHIMFKQSDFEPETQYIPNPVQGLLYDGDIMPKMPEVSKYTNHNRNLGIDIGCYNHQIDKLKYPLKLVSASFTGTYEDLDTPSYGDPDQGFHATYRNDDDNY